MYSIGTDIEDINRFYNKDEKFLNRIFTQRELDYCLNKKNPSCHLCARFCAKEAVIKALGEKIPYNKIEILKKENNSPYVNILIDKYKNNSFSISLSHEKDKAIACVIMEKNKE